jgi:serine/threonine-protein kinase
MAPQVNPLRSLSPDEPTLEASTPVPEHRACVELVEGSGPLLSAQTQSLLHVRLRGAALVLAAGSGVFLAKRFIYDSMGAATDPTIVFDDHLLLGLHVVHFLAMAALTSVLWRRSIRWSVAQLHAFELAIFGTTVIFFAAVQHYATLFTAKQYDYADDPIGVWCILILVYGMFIPNTWRRAALVIGGFCLAPIITLVYDDWRLGGDLITWDRIVSRLLLMSTEFGAVVYGTHIMGRLRREAYEARQLGQYRLRYRIGAGGMGEVYLAEHQMLKRPCAIKLIRANRANDPKALARFQREVRATATLSHWNTVEIFDYGSTEDGTFYYVMEYLPGLSLLDLVELYGPLPPERAVHLLLQTCDALREAHSIGLIHRDVKPGNIFAAQRGGVCDVAKLLDFGLVKPAGEGKSLELTEEGFITGSPLYMSPEQASGESEPDARSDIYSLGAVAYFLLTGKPPFMAEKPMRVVLAHINDAVVPPSQLRLELPPDLEIVVLRCLQKQPADRFQDVENLSRALNDCACAGLWTRQHAARWWSESHTATVAEAT